MARRNVIKEYLVSLGFNLDETSVAAVRRNIENSAVSVVNSMSAFNGSLKRGLAAYITFLTAARIGIAEFVSSVADADLQLQVNANRMWMNAEAYMHMENAAKSLGYTMQDLSSIARSPELTDRFRELTQLSQSVSAPQELGTMLKQVRDVTFEFTRLRVIAKNGIRQIVYYFLQDLGIGLDEIHYKLRSFVEYIRINLPVIAKKIADVLYVIWRLGSALMYVFGLMGRLISGVYRFFKEFPAIFAVFITAISVILLTLNPALTLITAAFAGLLLLVDDFLVWQKGGKSHFGDKWQGFVDTFTKIKKTIYDIAEKVNSFLMAIWNVIQKIKPFFEWLWKMVKTIADFLIATSDELDAKIDRTSKKVENLQEKLMDLFGVEDEDTRKQLKGQMDKAKQDTKDTVLNMAVSPSPVNMGISAFKYFKGLMDNIVVPAQKQQNVENNKVENRNKSNNAINFVQNLNINGVKGAYESTEQIKKYTERMLRNMSVSSVTR